MSHRQRVRAAVEGLCGEVMRPVTLEEIRGWMEVDTAPVHLDAVCGSLVRTQHLRAASARNWARERRNVYWPAGTEMVVDESATPASRPEVVATALQSIWSEPLRDNVPVSSREIRLFLKRAGTHPELLSQPTLLPTVLNGLRKAGRGGTPVITPVRVPGVRAQCWVPFGAAWVCPTQQEFKGTMADRIVAATRQAMERGNLLIVTQREVAELAQLDFEGPSGSLEFARRLAEASRPVPTGRGGRSARRHPHLVHLGEAAGQAHYTVPEFMRSARPAHLPPAVAAFEWRRLKEDWELARLEQELAHLTRPQVRPYLSAARGAAVRSGIAAFRSRVEALEGRTPPVVLTESACGHIRTVVSDAEAIANLLEVASAPSGCSGADARWHPTREAVAKLQGDFGLCDMPSHVIQSFIRDEVTRRRNPRYEGRAGARESFDCRWEYEEVSMRAAAAVRWGTPGVAMLARQAMSILGPVRDFTLVEGAMRNGGWTPIDAAAALGMLGSMRGLPILQEMSAASSSSAARRWISLATALISWQQSNGGNSPWRQVLW